MVISKFLDKLGINSFIANNGEEALQLLKQHPIDLLLLDIQMPIKDGYETVIELRQLEQNTQHNKHLPVIGLSAHGLKEDEQRALIAGMDDYLTKPIEFNILREKLITFFS